MLSWVEHEKSLITSGQGDLTLKSDVFFSAIFFFFFFLYWDSAVFRYIFKCFAALQLWFLASDTHFCVTWFSNDGDISVWNTCICSHRTDNFTSHHVTWTKNPEIHTLRKHLFKYTENFSTKKWKFSDKNSNIFHISAQNIDLGTP